MNGGRNSWAAAKSVLERLDSQNREIKNLQARLQASENAVKELYLGPNFRDFIKWNAEMVLPFRYIIKVDLEDDTKERTGSISTSPRGWFFADRVQASFYPTAGDNENLWRPLASSNPTIASSGAVDDVLNFSWGYSEARTNQSRQSESNLVPGDLLYRHDGDGFLLGGDPWSPATVVTVKVTPRIAPDNGGVLTFTFLGEQCVNAPDSLLDDWITRRRELARNVGGS
jgi:hypothetical protein